LLGDCIFDVDSEAHPYKKGLITGQCTIPGNLLNNGSYFISLNFIRNTSSAIYEFNECLSFDIEDFRENTAWYGDWAGVIRPSFKVQLQQGDFSYEKI
jgi:lipopolysaccharide transport system ATP-binding protein